MKTTYVFAFLISLLFPKVYAISPQPPIVQIPASNPAQVNFEPIPTHYSQAEIDEMTAHTFHPYILRTLIKCESQNVNIARMDSNGLISFGILQFNGTATWNTFAPRAGVLSSTPMNPMSAIKVADWMITHGEIHRWTCAVLTGIIN